jgi:four helix bundle protein
METKPAFQAFEDLEAYQAARQFRKAMYAVTRKLPAFEKFELASQIRRAAVSLTNNIAEGHGRYHYLDQVKFVLQARGSLEELMDDLNTAEKTGCSCLSTDRRLHPFSSPEKIWRNLVAARRGNTLFGRQ